MWCQWACCVGPASLEWGLSSSKHPWLLMSSTVQQGAGHIIESTLRACADILQVSFISCQRSTSSYLPCFCLSLAVFLQMESPVSTPAPPPLHLLASMGNSDIASPCEQLMVRTRSVAVNTSDVALSTEPECLGPCEPGTSVNLEGIVWQETEDGKKIYCGKSLWYKLRLHMFSRQTFDWTCGKVRLIATAVKRKRQSDWRVKWPSQFVLITPQ